MNEKMIKISSIVDNVLAEMYLEDKLNYEVKKEGEMYVINVFPSYFNDLNENVFTIVDNFISEIEIVVDYTVICRTFKTYADYINNYPWKTR